MQNNQRQIWIGACMLALVLLLHWPVRNAGFVADFWGWERQYRDQPFWAFLCTFGHPVHQQLPQMLNILLYRLFGTWGLPWYLVFSAVHAANGFLLYQLMLRWSRMWQIREGWWLGLAGALFFLCSPYITDATVWRVCLHYLLSGLFTSAALWWTTDYLENGNRRSIWYAHGVLLLHLMTLEMALATPFLVHALCFGWWLTRPAASAKAAPDWQTFLTRVGLPQLGLLAGFFAANKLSFGSWVGHYGEATHLQFVWKKMLAQPLKYWVKYATFGRQFEHGDKGKLFGWLESTTGLSVCYGLLALIIAVGLLYRRRAHPRLSLAVLLICMGLLACLPVSNLHFEWVLFNELDRYGYVPSLFFLPVMALLFSALPGIWKNLPAAAFLLVSLFYLLKMVGWWRDMDDCYKKLIRDFRWYDKREVFVLATADNLKGIWMFRTYKDKPALQYALELQQNRPLDIQFHEVAQYNMNSLKEGVGISGPDPQSGVIKVEFDQWGNWWWRHGLGASDYQNEDYKVVFKGKWYELTMKRAHPDAVFICQSGDGWKQL